MDNSGKRTKSAADPRGNEVMSRRLLIHVEGETEETFVNEVLSSHLRAHGYSTVSARIVGNARQRDRRGGIRGWNTVRNDVLKHLKNDPGCIATTMVDYYALPRSGARATATVNASTRYRIGFFMNASANLTAPSSCFQHNYGSFRLAVDAFAPRTLPGAVAIAFTAT